MRVQAVLIIKDKEIKGEVYPSYFDARKEELAVCRQMGYTEILNDTIDELSCANLTNDQIRTVLFQKF